MAVDGTCDAIGEQVNDTSTTYNTMSGKPGNVLREAMLSLSLAGSHH
jgi:hypothetical protein